jgi:hypothetical protein
MAGRKHHNQFFITPNMKKNGDVHFLSNATDFERGIAEKAMNQLTYCKHCGKFIYATDVDENGAQSNPEWELANGAHYKCAVDAQAKAKEQLKKAQAEEDARRKEADENFDWDGYMKKMLEQRGE